MGARRCRPCGVAFQAAPSPWDNSPVEISHSTTANGPLHLCHATGGELAGYSGTPLSAKLGIRAGYEIHLVGAPDEYLKLVEPMPEDVKIAVRLSRNTDLVHVF